MKNDWSINSKIESRILLQRSDINGNIDKNSAYLLTDFSFIAAKTIELNSRVLAGYLIRFEKGDVLHRLIQQYVIVQKFSGFRLAHRFLSDQTFTASEKPDFRLRYRITSELSLNGESVDAREFYLKINHEYLNSLQARTYDLEVRLVPLLGYGITESFKLEIGVDSRVNSFLANNSRFSNWIKVNFFIDLR